MKVALLSTNDYGGAARAAVRLCGALHKQDVVSDIFVKYKKSNLDYIKQIRGPQIHNLLIENIAQEYFYSNIYEGNTMLSMMYPSLSFDFQELVDNYDIINLHWIASFVSLESIVKLASQKPIVWTLHDQNPMTGACHYAHGCNKYLIDCNDCPQMKKNELNLTKVLLEAKIKYMPRNLVVVTPSKWLAECAKKSPVFKKNRIEVIPNSVELDIFKPMNKNKAKKMFGFPEDMKIILFGAENHKERRKGFVELMEAMQRLKEMPIMQEFVRENKIAVLAFGNESEEIKKLNIPYAALGYIEDDNKLAWAYSAADVVALPSLEDNLPNIILEAFACKTPVVGFDFGGMPDFIQNGKTGYVVPIGNTKLFAEKLAAVLLEDFLGDNCRKCAELFFAQSKQAERYHELFSDLVKNNNVEDNRNFELSMFPEVGSIFADLLCKSGILCQKRINELVEEKDLLYETLNRINEEKAGMQEWLDKLVIEKNKIQECIDKMVIEKNYFQMETDIYKKRVDYLIKERNLLQGELDAVLLSRSWYITKPLRKCGSWLKAIMK